MENTKIRRYLIRGMGVLGAVVLFFLSLSWLNAAFKVFLSSSHTSLLSYLGNPFLGFFVGLLVVAIVQSSSSITTVLVLGVSSGVLSFSQAFPVVMGANMGTTFTSTLIALSYMGQRKRFRRAMETGLTHDFFNLFTALILLALEAVFHIFEPLGRLPAQFETLPFAWSFRSPVSLGLIEDLRYALVNVFSHPSYTFFAFLIPLLTVWLSIRWASRLLYRFIPIKQALALPSTSKAFAWGLWMTAIIQSSSLSTSVLVSFAAQKKIARKRIAAFIIGANIGTTFTAMIGALKYANPVALLLALFHLLFNAIGGVIFGSTKPTRYLWLISAQRTARYLTKYPSLGVVYAVVLFFLIPYLLIFLFN